MFEFSGSMFPNGRLPRSPKNGVYSPECEPKVRVVGRVPCRLKFSYAACGVPN